MTTFTTGGTATSWESDGRLARRSRIASVVLVSLVVLVSTFALWASRATDHAAKQAVSASRQSDHYAAAATAIAAEESLQRMYLLEPGPNVRDRFGTVSDTTSGSAAQR